MKVLFIAEYFYPYTHGGGEISIKESARTLSSYGESVHILTPNYGAEPIENVEGYTIHRFFFPVRFKKFSDQLSPSWYFNAGYFLALFFQTMKIVLAEKIQIIHVHSICSLPSAVFAAKILRIPVVVTFRDNQLLCNYGHCLTKNQFGRACNLKDYFFEDFSRYWKNMVPNKNVFALITQFVFAIVGRIRTNILQFVVHFADIRIVSSLAQQKTFAANGFKTEVVYNIVHFPQKPPVNKPTGKIILYATKMSPGKGLDILLEAFKQVLSEIPDATLQLVGSGDKKHYEEISKSLHIAKNVDFHPRKSHEDIMKMRQKALLEVAPSVYPESFGRTALESLASGVPVVASNRGGLTDIVENNKTGYIVNPVAHEIAKAIVKAIKNNQNLRQNIRKEYPRLKHKFSEKPLEDHLRLYKSILK